MQWYTQFLLGLFATKASPEEVLLLSRLMDIAKALAESEEAAQAAYRNTSRIHIRKRLRYRRIQKHAQICLRRMSAHIDELIRDVALLGPTAYLPPSMQPINKWSAALGA